ncbi:MAG: hypothetical protein ACLFS3_03190 [Candidatus Aenigmatarchaeota archaeon]
MAGSIIGTMITNMENLGFFAYMLPWLLTLAVTFGILENYEIPESVSARGVISIVMAFLVLPVGNYIAPFFEDLVMGFIVLAAGILVAVIFVELLGFESAGVDNIFLEHPQTFGAIMIILAALVFIGAGGLNFIGVDIQVSEELVTLLFFLAAISIGVWFITSKEE